MSLKTAYKHDVFISYSSLDSEWVYQDFLPHMEKAGLNVMLDRDFEIGRPIINNIENAISTSRYTILVITPEWIESVWCEFEGLLILLMDFSGVFDDFAADCESLIRTAQQPG